MEKPLYFVFTAKDLQFSPHYFLTPNSTILLLTLGIALIYVELNRPGSILPGALGLLITLLAIAPLVHQPVNPSAIIAILAATVILARNIRRSTPLLLHLIATICLIGGFLFLITAPSAPHISPIVAVPCGLILGIGTSILTRIARRARRNKGLD